MNKAELERALKYTKQKHEYDKLNTFDTNISMLCFDALAVLNNCIEIPNNATNGDMVLATGMFKVVKELNDGIMVYVKPKGVFGQVLEYTKDWWDAPFKGSEGQHDQKRSDDSYISERE